MEGLDAPTRSKLALKGSAKVVTDYFEYSIHSILYQRGIYPASDFKIVRKYGLNMLVSMDDEVIAYIEQIMKQIRRWVYSGIISKLVIVIISKETGQVVERWRFDLDGSVGQPSSEVQAEAKANQQIQKEIQSIIRQITASVTFLPELQGDQTFNVLVYANPHCKAPEDWKDSGAKELEGGSIENVKFRSFSTDQHSVSTYVTYRVNDN